MYFAAGLKNVVKASARARDAIWSSQELIRAELFSAERLEEYAESLAHAQLVTEKPRRTVPIAARLKDNSRVLLEAHRAIASAIAEGYAITPAAEWLVENYHVVEEQIWEIGDDLPPGYYRQLPKLDSGSLAGYPRVLGIAWAYVGHTDSRLDLAELTRFLHAYQRIQVLTIGELWAIAISLRIVLVENLRRAAERISARRRDREMADALADRLLATGESGSAPMNALLDRHADAAESMTFSVQLLLRLRDQDPKVTPAVAWLEGRLKAMGTNSDETVRQEHQRQGASNVTVRNIITSMRTMSSANWSELFEQFSLVDAELRDCSSFGMMDFPTRDRYRAAIEGLSRGSNVAEIDVTRKAIAMAQAGTCARERDPGFYLIAGGRSRLIRSIGYKPLLRTLLSRAGSAAGIRGYMAGATVVTAVLLAFPFIALASRPISAMQVWMLVGLAMFPVLDAAVALINASIASRLGPKILPALELREGVPPELRTMVVVPTLLASVSGIAADVHQLEIHHLASLDGEIHFALLTDWCDSSSETTSSDGLLLEEAVSGIRALNRRYGLVSGHARFFLLHRKRKWNSAQGVWMGWERKRGKLKELNELLRGSSETTFIAIDGHQPSVPPGVRYVVTLDADTRLPRDAVKRLVGKMAHPINMPRFDATLGRVVEGYGILQPRVSPSLPTGGAGSVFQRLLSSVSGIDPYASAVSDVYQDLCGEGSYVGKGIYDVDAFENALHGRVPDNTMLSHDLFEGIFARAGLVSDVELVEEYPSRYDVAAARSHRWARGDWQLVPWLLGIRGRRGNGGLRGMPLIGQWKVADNLRRTLVAPTAVGALLFGWTLPIGAAWKWTAFLLLIFALPSAPPLLASLVPRSSRMSASSRLGSLWKDTRLAALQTALHVTFLADQAVQMIDAMGRTIFRLIVSRRLMLEWVTAAQTQTGKRLGWSGFYWRMRGACCISLATLALAWYEVVRPQVAVPFAMLWILSPLVARLISLPPRPDPVLRIGLPQVAELRRVARRTWCYFEEFVTAADNMLPPDNFQEDPNPVIAHRTSPTNVGLYLLSTVAARDFGWIGTIDMLGRLESTLFALRQLERYKGHFYNWYDTQDLRPLLPKYVSTVDSGNLAAHLLTAANACTELLGRTPNASFTGAGDALDLARAALRPEQAELVSGRQYLVAFDAEIVALHSTLANVAQSSATVGPRLDRFIEQCAQLADRAAGSEGCLSEVRSSETRLWLAAAVRAVDGQQRDLDLNHGAGTAATDDRLQLVASGFRELARAMRFDFLYDQGRKLLSIGYRVLEGSRDPNCYDLLASEARLASLIAVAGGDLPAKHWFSLGRAVTPVPGGAALVSWSGSMFEYLMPSLVMRSPIGSLLEQTNRLIVRRQQEYGRALHIPWGMSESAYNARDLEFTYQYSSFGVPGLGLKRGLASSLVVAPYATGLAAMVDPTGATLNFRALSAAGGLGAYGFYESLDYTRQRVPEGHTVVVVAAFMAHHQGMTIVALANALLDGVMRARFHSEAEIEATELLLHERAPRVMAVARIRAEEIASGIEPEDFVSLSPRAVYTPHSEMPQTNLMSNGRYAVMVTSAGSGYSRWKDLAITRWREDATRDDWGSHVFLRDADSGTVWSAGYQPTCVEPAEYEVTFKEDRSEFLRRDDGFTTRLEVLVSAESDAEVRRVSITNRTTRTRRVDVTSYSEIVLGPTGDDNAHPAFSKLFVQTDYVAEIGALLATRRRRSPGDPEVWAAQLAVIEGETVGNLQWETDRAKFLGRGRETFDAAAMHESTPLSGTVGTVLDAIFSLRQCVRIAPGSTVRIAFWTVVAPTRVDVLALADKHRDSAAFDRAATLAWTQAQVQLHHLGIRSDEADLFQRLASHLLFADPAARATSGVLLRADGGIRSLWPHGVSGDIPIVLIRIDDADDLQIVRQLLRAIGYWRLKQLVVDLVILNERAPSYTQDLQSALEALISLNGAHATGLGNTVILRTDLISEAARAMLLTAARVVLLSRRGSLAEQIERMERSSSAVPPAVAWQTDSRTATVVEAALELEFFNGFGGFDTARSEYVIRLSGVQMTPTPWVNVVANPRIGFQVAAEGAGSSWVGNSRDNQLSTWSNDPVSNRTGEALYVRDEDSGIVFGPTAAPVRNPSTTYVARHGRGYSEFSHHELGIALELLQFVPVDDPVKISRLRLRNESGRSRRLSVTAYIEWVLGTSRGGSAPFVWTSIDPHTGAMLAGNLDGRSTPHTAFSDLGLATASWTGDRSEFLGRNGNLSRPAALARIGGLSCRVGAGIDPCGALQSTIDLPANGTIDVVWLLGQVPTLEEAQILIKKWRSADLGIALSAVRAHWASLTDAIKVQTPDRSFNVLVNGQLIYQTVASRIYARSGFYQASGAYGFRDQLQDGMALGFAAPALARQHLVRAAGRQFAEGDVQHWWLPETGRGVRTRISDDRAWLAYGVARYVAASGDHSIFDEVVPFIEGALLRESETDTFFEPSISRLAVSVWEHCVLAIEHSLQMGVHGLPLIGSGDWNDGMNRVGVGGRGESVWLGWLLIDVLERYSALCAARGDTARSLSFSGNARSLRDAMERTAWDGEWYRRGYIDDGSPLGAAGNLECRIDSIAQSWSVISRAGDVKRSRQAMAAVGDHLIQRESATTTLFSPPFSISSPDPGYIMAYPPGIRENGGQYTHAAAWSVIALAMLGEGDKASELFAMLNPINHARTPAEAVRYAVEPYVVAADVYSVPPHDGRGGWTWYTGSAAWLYQAAVEWILGIRLCDGAVLVDPCIPAAWPGFSVTVRAAGASLDVVVENPRRVCRGVTVLEVEGVATTVDPPLILGIVCGRSYRVLAILG